MIDFSFRFAKLLHFFDITKFFSIKKHKKGNFLGKIMFFSIFFKIDTCFCTFWHAIWNVISAFEYVNLCYYNIIIFSVFLLWFGSPGGGPSYFIRRNKRKKSQRGENTKRFGVKQTKRQENAILTYSGKEAWKKAIDNRVCIFLSKNLHLSFFLCTFAVDIVISYACFVRTCAFVTKITPRYFQKTKR